MLQSYNRYRAVTASDSADIGELTKALWIGGAGNLVAVMQNGTTCTFTGIPAGSWLPIACKRVNSTDTTATSIVALFQT